jgi:hypothetical protein
MIFTHLYEARATKREPSQKISSTIILWVRKSRGRILREAIGYGGACASRVSSDWNLGFSLLFCSSGGAFVSLLTCKLFTKNAPSKRGAGPNLRLNGNVAVAVAGVLVGDCVRKYDKMGDVDGGRERR